MKPSQTLISAAKAVISARAMVETLRPQIEQVQQDLLNVYDIRCDKKWGRASVEGVLTPKTAFLMSDEDAAIFHEELDKEYRRLGYTEIEKGQCPLLIAENLQRKAERIFAEACVELTARVGLDAEKIDHLMNCTYGMDERNKFLELNLKYVVPFIPRKELCQTA